MSYCYLCVRQMLRDDVQRCASAFDSVDPDVLSAGNIQAADYQGWCLALRDSSTRMFDHFFVKTSEGYLNNLSLIWNVLNVCVFHYCYS